MEYPYKAAVRMRVPVRHWLDAYQKPPGSGFVHTAGGNATYQILGGRGGQVQAGAFYAESIFTARSDLHVYSR